MQYVSFRSDEAFIPASARDAVCLFPAPNDYLGILRERETVGLSSLELMSHCGYRKQNAEQSDNQYPAWWVEGYPIAITPNNADHHSDEAKKDGYKVDCMSPPLVEPQL